jgi:uncharacterized membrane protein YphA (DoxX/SURF4 family)
MNLSEYSDYAFWFLRAVVGVIFIVHGYAKTKTPGQTGAMYGMPAFVGLLHGLVEILGGIFLIVDWQAQYVGIVFAVIMLGAIFFKIGKWKVPFMTFTATGWEFDLILLAAALLIAVS